MSRYCALFLIKCIQVYSCIRQRRYPVCRFLPNCCAYATTSLLHLSLFGALYCIFFRLLKCQSWIGYNDFCIDMPLPKREIGEERL